MYQLIIVGASPEGLGTAQWCVDHYPESRVALITQGWEQFFLLSDIPQHGREKFWESLRLLAAQGIDVVVGKGVFHSKAGELIYQTEERVLVGAKYLLTSLPFNFVNNDIITQLNSRKNTEVKRWGIVGALPGNFILAQALLKQDHQVDIISGNSYLLPREEQEIGDLLQSYLENLGINFWFDCGEVTSHYDQAKNSYNLNFFQDGSKDKTNLMVDHFISLHSGKSSDFENLFTNLPEFNQNNFPNKYPYLEVNNVLQTVHPQIYACGDWLRGYQSEIVAREEAKYVANQLLGKNFKPIDYRHIPFGINLDPPFYRIGLTKSEADRQGIEVKQIINGFEPYGDHWDLRGMCKVITDRQDLILGAHWFGPGSKVGIYLFTLAIAKGITFSELRNLPLAEALINFRVF